MLLKMFSSVVDRILNIVTLYQSKKKKKEASYFAKKC